MPSKENSLAHYKSGDRLRDRKKRLKIREINVKESGPMIPLSPPSHCVRMHTSRFSPLSRSPLDSRLPRVSFGVPIKSFYSSIFPLENPLCIEFSPPRVNNCLWQTQGGRQKAASFIISGTNHPDLRGLFLCSKDVAVVGYNPQLYISGSVRYHLHYIAHSGQQETFSPDWRA